MRFLGVHALEKIDLSELEQMSYFCFSHSYHEQSKINLLGGFLQSLKLDIQELQQNQFVFVNLRLVTKSRNSIGTRLLCSVFPVVS